MGGGGREDERGGAADREVGEEGEEVEEVVRLRRRRAQPLHFPAMRRRVIGTGSVLVVSLSRACVEEEERPVTSLSSGRP